MPKQALSTNVLTCSQTQKLGPSQDGLQLLAKPRLPKFGVSFGEPNEELQKLGDEASSVSDVLVGFTGEDGTPLGKSDLPRAWPLAKNIMRKPTQKRSHKHLLTAAVALPIKKQIGQPNWL